MVCDTSPPSTPPQGADLLPSTRWQRSARGDGHDGDDHDGDDHDGDDGEDEY